MRARRGGTRERRPKSLQENRQKDDSRQGKRATRHSEKKKPVPAINKVGRNPRAPVGGYRQRPNREFFEVIGGFAASMSSSGNWAQERRDRMGTQQEPCVPLPRFIPLRPRLRGDDRGPSLMRKTGTAKRVPDFQTAMASREDTADGRRNSVYKPNGMEFIRMIQRPHHGTAAKASPRSGHAKKNRPQGRAKKPTSTIHRRVAALRLGGRRPAPDVILPPSLHEPARIQEYLRRRSPTCSGPTVAALVG